MESPTAKRRNLASTDTPPASPPVETESAMPPDPPPGPALRPIHQSFASPTRASLERYNPEILRRREILQSRKSSDEELSGPATHPATQRLFREPEVGPQDDASSDRADRISQSPFRRRVGGLMAVPLKRTLVTKPNLRSPAPEPEKSLEDRISRRKRVRMTPPDGPLPRAATPEPGLPPVSKQPNPAPNAPLIGYHTEPSKLPKRSKALASRIKSSSPLKLFPRRPVFHGKLPSKTMAPLVNAKRGEVRMAFKTQNTKSLRGIEPADPNADHQRLRDTLKAELEALKRDSRVLAAENDRMRGAHLAQTRMPAPPNARELLDVLQRHVILKDEGKQAQKEPFAALLDAAIGNPAALLPFGKPNSSFPLLFWSEENSKTSAELPITHHPIPMKAEEALPYLQLFTPLSFTSMVTCLPAEPNEPLLQQHSITAKSTNPPGFFMAHIQMTVNTDSHTITELAVPCIEPAAAAELMPFIDSLVKPVQTCSGTTNNITVLTWAMAEWLRVSIHRAKVWFGLEQAFGTEDALTKTVARMRGRRKIMLNTKRGAAAARDQDEKQVQEPEGGSEATTADLREYMGRTAFDLQVPSMHGSKAGESSLRVSWKIEFDWTGEAQSKISVSLGAPGKWHKGDKRNGLSAIRKIFQEVLRAEEDPAAAVKTMVALLAGGAEE